MQMPIPPVSQWSRKQRASPDHENRLGTKAKSAPTWIAPIQAKGPQAM